MKEVLGVTFTVQVENFGQKMEVELKEGGADIFVTEENREEYVELYIKYEFGK